MSSSSSLRSWCSWGRTPRARATCSKGESGHPRHEPLGLNHTLVSNRQFSGEHRYPDFDRLREELSAWQTYYLDPRIAMREPQPPREVSDIGPRGEWIAPFLYRLKESEAHRKYFRAIGRALKSTIDVNGYFEPDSGD